MKLRRSIQPRVSSTNPPQPPLHSEAVAATVPPPPLLNREAVGATDPPSLRILRIRDVMNRTALSRSTIWRLQRDNKFPLSVELSGSLVGWHESEIDEWLRNRPRSR